MNPGTVPLLVVALLLLAGQPGVETVTTVVDGDRPLPDGADAVVLAGGNVTVPANATTRTSLYVIEGAVAINGTLDGRLVQFAGAVDVGSGGTVTGPYRVYGGDRRIADGAAVVVEPVAAPVTRERSPLETVGFVLVQAIGLAVVAFLVGGRYPDLLATVGHAVRHHPIVSGTVGLLASASGVALLVFMAFTIVLLPVSLLGLVVGGLVYLYALLGLGFLLGRRFAPERPGLACAGGSVAVLLALYLLGAIPVVGAVVPIAAILVGVGAVVVTYFGLREFEPATIPPVGE